MESRKAKLSPQQRMTTVMEVAEEGGGRRRKPMFESGEGGGDGRELQRLENFCYLATVDGLTRPVEVDIGPVPGPAGMSPSSIHFLVPATIPCTTSTTAQRKI
ncbi:hypothetical protein LINGRAHAP2_LOCUS27007 [Linum grandiflorum]